MDFAKWKTSTNIEIIAVPLEVARPGIPDAWTVPPLLAAVVDYKHEGNSRRRRYKPALTMKQGADPFWVSDLAFRTVAEAHEIADQQRGWNQQRTA